MEDTRKQLLEEIYNSQKNYSKYYDGSKRDVDKDLKPGAQVWLRFEGFELDGLKLKGTSAKLRPRFVGPFVIKEQVSDVSFRIKLPQTKIDSGLHDVFHSRNLIVNRPNADSVLPAAHFDSNLNEELWEIEHIIAHDKHGKQNRFLIKWKGWPEVLATWISEAVFRTDAPEMLSEYMKRHNIESDGQVDETGVQTKPDSGKQKKRKRKRDIVADSDTSNNDARQAAKRTRKASKKRKPADGAVSADQLAGRKKARAAKSLSNSRKVTKGPSVPQRRKSKRAAGLKTRSTTRSLTLQSLNAIL